MAIKHTVKHLTPLALLALLIYTPKSTLERYLGATATTLFRAKSWPSLIRPILKALLGLGTLRTLNTALNAVAQNNWRIASGPPPGSARWDWPHEIAVVTGGCGGLGQSLVAGLTAQGVRVAVLDVLDPAAVPAVLRANPRAAYFRCDVTSPDAVRDAAARVRKEFGGRDPTILVHNAGVAARNAILDVPEQALRRVLGVNLMSLWFTTQAFLPGMVRQNKGHVVTVASLASFVALPASVEYSASKAGALAFHEGLACEIKTMYKAPGVVTSVVHPNFVRTPMTAPFAHLIEPVQRMLEVEDVTGPVVEQIFSGRGAQIVIPKRLTLLSGLRGWPSWMQEALRDTMGRSQ